MTERLDEFQDLESLTDLILASDSALDGGFGAGIMLTVFVVSFYRLSDAGFIPAYTASSFITAILAFLLASAELVPVSIPFLVGVGSMAGLAYMYGSQRL